MKRSRNRGVYRYGQWIYEVRVRRRWKRWWERQALPPASFECSEIQSSTELLQNHTWISFGGPMVKVE